MKIKLLMSFYGLLLAYILSSALSADTFEVDEKELEQHTLSMEKYDKGREEFKAAICMLKEPSTDQTKHHIAKEKIEDLAVNGDPLAIRYLWELRVGVESKSEFVRDFLANDSDLIALGEIGTLVLSYSYKHPDIFDRITSLINKDSEASSLEPKFILAQSMGYMVSEYPKLEKKHEFLSKALNLLHIFESSSEAKTIFSQGNKYVQRAYYYLFTHASKSKYMGLFDKYIADLMQEGAGENLSIKGISSFYLVMRNLPDDLSSLQNKYNFNFEMKALQ